MHLDKPARSVMLALLLNHSRHAPMEKPWMARTRKPVSKNNISPSTQRAFSPQRETPAIHPCVTYTLRPDDYVVVSTIATTQDILPHDAVGRPLPEMWPQVGAMLA